MNTDQLFWIGFMIAVVAFWIGRYIVPFIPPHLVHPTLWIHRDRVEKDLNSSYTNPTSHSIKNHTYSNAEKVTYLIDRVWNLSESGD